MPSTRLFELVLFHDCSVSQSEAKDRFLSVFQTNYSQIKAHRVSSNMFFAFPSLAPHYRTPLLLIWSSRNDGLAPRLVDSWTKSRYREQEFHSLTQALRHPNGFVENGCLLAALQSLLRLRPNNFRKPTQHEAHDQFSAFLEIIQGCEKDGALATLDVMVQSLWSVLMNSKKINDKIRRDFLRWLITGRNEDLEGPCGRHEQVYWEFRHSEIDQDHEHARQHMEGLNLLQKDVGTAI